jgi:dGTPase
VSQIARTIARALDLNEDLAEAIALGHDLGHAPFGHAGEEAMQQLVPGGFRLEMQSLRVVEKLENDGRGLNLTAEVRDGILRHSKGSGPIIDVSDEQKPMTLEGWVVRLADRVAYVNHDLDDALRAKVVRPEDLPQGAMQSLGATHSTRLTTLVLDIVENTDFEVSPVLSMSEKAMNALEELREFLFQRVYYNALVHSEFKKADTLIRKLWDYFVSDMDRFYDQHWPAAIKDGAPEEDVRDFMAGMTDAFAINLHEKIFTPRRWYVF